MDVLPHVQLRPVRKRKYADAFAWLYAAVEQIPQLGPLILRIPLTQPIPERKDAFLGSRLLLIPPGAAERGVIISFAQSIEQRLSLKQPAAPLRPQPVRI